MRLNYLPIPIGLIYPSMLSYPTCWFMASRLPTPTVLLIIMRMEAQEVTCLRHTPRIMVEDNMECMDRVDRVAR